MDGTDEIFIALTEAEVWVCLFAIVVDIVRRNAAGTMVCWNWKWRTRSGFVGVLAILLTMHVPGWPSLETHVHLRALLS